MEVQSANLQRLRDATRHYVANTLLNLCQF